MIVSIYIHIHIQYINISNIYMVIFKHTYKNTCLFNNIWNTWHKNWTKKRCCLYVKTVYICGKTGQWLTGGLGLWCDQTSCLRGQRDLLDVEIEPGSEALMTFQCHLLYKTAIKWCKPIKTKLHSKRTVQFKLIVSKEF